MELYHHGILGQKWGKKNGPPYPLKPEEHSKAEQKAGWQKSLDDQDDKNGSSDSVSNVKNGAGSVVSQSGKVSYKNAVKDEKTSKGSDRTKKVLIAVGAVAITGIAAYGVYKYYGATGALLNEPIDLSNVVTDTDATKLPGLSDFETPDYILENSFYKDLDAKDNIPVALEQLKFPKEKSIAESWKQINVQAQSTIDYQIENNYIDNIKKLTKSEQSGIVKYTGSSYITVNKYLRNPEKAAPLSPFYADIVKNATSALEKCRTKEDMIVYRGMGSDGLWKALNLGSEKDLIDMVGKDPDCLKGVVFSEKGFCSCGIRPDKSFGGVVMHTKVPAGSKGMYVDPISKHYAERELLLQRNSSFRIVDFKVDPKFGDVTDIFVELIDQTLPG